MNPNPDPNLKYIVTATGIEFFGDLSLAELETSVGLFAQKVMPALRDLDVLANAA